MRLRRFLLLGPLAAGLLLGPGCARREGPAAAARRSQTLLLGNGAEPQDLDPQIVVVFTDQNIVISLFEGLTCMDEKTSQPVPGVAERWEASADGLAYTFHLRADARWSDGSPLTADDFVFSFRRILSPGLASEYSYLLYPIKNAEAFNTGKLADFSAVGVRALDAHTLRLELGHPCPYLPALASLPPWFPVPRATIEKFGPFDRRGTAWTHPGNLVGNGAFVLKEWSPNARIVVETNPLYWDAAHNSLHAVVFFPNDNIATDEANFRAGQLHVTNDLLPDRIAHYRATAPQSLRIDPFIETYYLGFNTTRPPLNDPRVRQALGRAIDREAIARDVLQGSRPPAYAFTPPDTAGYTPIARLPTDFVGARQLLAAAGYPGGKGFPHLQIQMFTDAINTKVLEAIQQMWHRELGIEVTLTNQDYRVYIDEERSLAYDISLMRWIGDYDDPSTFIGLYRSDCPNNWTGWKDPAYDRLNDQADGQLDPARRFAFLQQAEARLLDQAPIAPIFHGTRTYLIQPYVQGWVPSLLGTHRYQYVRLEP
jgi:oligopeptide transport system substrate-binding protein